MFDLNAQAEALSKLTDAVMKLNEDLLAIQKAMPLAWMQNEAPKAPPALSGESPVIIRYIRFEDYYDPTGNLGGVTFAFKLDHEAKKCRVGVAICEFNDNFNKRFGRDLATTRLYRDPITFDHETPNQVSLVEAFQFALEEGTADLGEDNLSLIRKLVTEYMITQVPEGYLD